jgi:hypothetical protein
MDRRQAGLVKLLLQAQAQAKDCGCVDAVHEHGVPGQFDHVRTMLVRQ